MQIRITPALLLVCVLFCATTAKASPPVSPLWGNLSPGRFSVGFRLLTVFDPARDSATAQPNRGRPLQIAIWYPAQPARQTSRLTLAQYLQVSDNPAQSTLPRGESVDELHKSLSLQISAQPNGIDPRLLDRLLGSPMFAVWNAAPVKRKSPLVLWSARHGTILAQSVMCEYLASHGYVVGFARYQGAPLPLPYQAKSAAEKRATLAEHVTDLELALSSLSRLPTVDASTVAAISWSYAGESATLLQMRQRAVDVVISLSSNVLTGWVYQETEALSKIDLSQLQVPYILMTEKVSTSGEERQAPEVLQRLPGGAYFVRFNELAHGNFNAIEGMIPSLMGITQVPRWSKAGSLAQQGYEAVCQSSLHFLNHYLKPAKTTEPLEIWDYKAKLPEKFVEVTRFRPAPRKR